MRLILKGSRKATQFVGIERREYDEIVEYFREKGVRCMEVGDCEEGGGGGGYREGDGEEEDEEDEEDGEFDGKGEEEGDSEDSEDSVGLVKEE